MTGIEPATRPLRALVVDDEPLARDCVREVLRKDPRIEVVGEAVDGAAAVEAIRALHPDVVFLDVQMPGGSGLDVVAAIGASEMPVTIFVTAFDHHAIQAFDAHALDYVLKPFDDERLLASVDRACALVELRSSRDLVARLDALLADRAAAATPAAAQRLMLRSDDRVVPVQTADIDLIESDGNYVIVHARGASHRTRATLASVLEHLDAARFVRVHKRTILNLDRVRELQPWFGGDYVAILHDGRKVRVSRTFAPAVLTPFR